MKRSLFIGIDISKATLDVSVISPTDTNCIHYQQFANHKKGFSLLLKWINHCSERVPVQQWRVCMENTGIYCLELNCFLEGKGIWQCLENALQIKRSMGVLRGKSDSTTCSSVYIFLFNYPHQLSIYGKYVLAVL
jgi:transposase